MVTSEKPGAGKSTVVSNVAITYAQAGYIVDTPPVNTVTDAQLYARAIKDSLLVIDSEKNDKNEVKKAKTLMEKAGSNILGVILNKAKVDKSSSYYHYYGDE
ncbi:capsular polysaccharide synthesis enzyme [Staphylococcus aureus]|nr:capsular polysaccharide synthesis enzyme [Staphylococcus aureus]